MNNTSSQDEFAKWAKARRRHDKTLEEYEALSAFTFHLRTSRQLTIYRQGPHISKILLRLDRQDRPLAQHKRTEDLPSVLVLEDSSVPAASWLVPLLCGMDCVVPSRAFGICQYPGLEQCVCCGDCACCGGCGSSVCPDCRTGTGQTRPG